MAILLALLSAAAYGTSDFIGGIVSKRSSAWQTAVVAALAAGLCTVPVALLAGGSPAGDDWLLGAVAGLGTGFGSAFLYRGLSTAKMSVVAPLAAVVNALLPVAVGLATGDRPGVAALIGIACAIPAILLVAGAGSGERPHAQVHEYDHTHEGAPLPQSSGVLDGLLAGAGFGVMFVAADRIGDDAGFAPMVTMQLFGVLAIALLATALREGWVPRERSAWRGVAIGPLVAAAIVCLLLATREGMLSVVSVLVALYPAVTVLLAAALLGERVERTQAAGLGLALVAVALVASG